MLILHYNITMLAILTGIRFTDKLLINLFGNKARWYQLHVVCNLVVTSIIIEDTIKLYRDPFNNYRILDNHITSYIILCTHLYHILAFNNLNKMDYFHHILFVIFGVIPTIFYIKSDQIYFGYIACSGLPGVVEYFLLSLYKNNLITKEKQKKITAGLYNYIRCPMCIYGATINILALNYNDIMKSENVFFTYYINILLYMNGVLFNQLTLKSYHQVIFAENLLVK